MEREADWYDKHSDEVCQPLLRSPWLGLYSLLAQWVESVADFDNCQGVVDIGSGPGRFGELLAARGYGHRYIGYDFSKRCRTASRTHVLNGDVRDPDARELMYRWPGVVVFSEVLEHLDDDLAVVRDVPYDRLVIITGPSFRSEAHVRCYAGLSELQARYADLFSQIRLMGAVDLSPPIGHRIYALAGWRARRA